MNKDEMLKFLQKQLEQSHQQNKDLLNQNKELHFKIDKMQAQLDKLLRQLYGRKSEQVTKKSKDKDNNKDDDSDPGPGSNSGKTTSKKSTTSKKPKRKKLPEHLARDTIYHDLQDSEKHCSACNQDKQRISEERSERLEFIPASLYVQEHVRYTYKCACCIETVPMPEQAVDKGIPGPGLLADVVISKYEDATPLYRQNQRFFRQNNINIPESTLCDWVAKTAFWLEPIVDIMKRDQKKALKIHSDDTTVPVLAKGKTKTGRLWVYLTDGTDIDGRDTLDKKKIQYKKDNNINTHKCTVYEYTPTRAGFWPLNFLKGFKGFLQADAYAGYDEVINAQKLTEVACMAHARRYFFDVAAAAKGESIAHDALEQFGKLYGVEKKCKNMSAFQRYRYRKRHSKPILRKLKRWLKYQAKRLLPNTPIIRAVNYALNHWRALCNYLSNGYLDIDNNKGERAMRRVAIGRKNWTFAGSDEGGKRAAIIYSILETCKQNNINPFDYLRDILTRIPGAKQSEIESLTPYNWQPV